MNQDKEGVVKQSTQVEAIEESKQEIINLNEKMENQEPRKQNQKEKRGSYDIRQSAHMREEAYTVPLPESGRYVLKNPSETMPDLKLKFSQSNQVATEM